MLCIIVAIDREGEREKEEGGERERDYLIDWLIDTY